MILRSCFCFRKVQDTMGLLKLLILLFCITSAKCYLEHDSWVNIELSHALDPEDLEKFSYRGNITVVSLESGNVNIIQDALSDVQRKNFLVLARTNQFYRIRAKVGYSDGSFRTFLSSTRACSLLLSQLNDILWVSIDSTGYVNAITLTSTGSESSEKCSSRDSSASELEDFNTDVLIRRSEIAPVPDTVSFIQKLDREREARERGDVRDTRGFFAKYWMYIVPVVLLLFISGATNQDTNK